MFAFIKAVFKKEAKVDARVAKWMDKREQLIVVKFRLVAAADTLTDRTYYRAMASIKHRIARVNGLLRMAGQVV